MKFRITKEVRIPWVCDNCNYSFEMRLLPATMIGGQEIGGTVSTIQCACRHVTTGKRFAEMALASMGLTIINEST